MRLARACVAAFAGALALAGAAAAQTGPLTVSSDRDEISSRLGADFGFKTTISNSGSAATERLVAHLNILTLRPGLYVDPEDWSSQRTVFLDPIPAGGTVTVNWSMKAVGSGRLAAYVAVLPRDRPADPPATSPSVRVNVEERTLINAGGILPLALAVPALIGGLAGGIRFARRRR